MEVFTIKVYRCDKDNHKVIIGTIEDVNGNGGIFTSYNELMEMLPPPPTPRCFRG